MTDDSGRLRSAGPRPEPEEVSAFRAAPAIAVFAEAPKDWCAAYLTPGREYPVLREEGSEAFWIINDNGTESYCLWTYCGHLLPPGGIPCGSWKRIERPADTPNVSGLSHTGGDRG